MPLKPCRECGEEVSSEADTCPSCGVPNPTASEEEVRRQKRQKRVLKTVGIGMAVLAVPFLVFVGWGLLSYGTGLPCGMLRSEIMAQYRQQSGNDFGTGSGLEEAGEAIGMALGTQILDSYLEGMPPWKCGYAVTRLQFGGEELGEMDLGSGSTNLSDLGSTEESDVQPRDYSAQGSESGFSGSGGGEPEGEVTVPSWMQVDKAAETVTIDLEAGATSANNHWNFNGHYGGGARVVVPEGYDVTVQFRNLDDLSPHSFTIKRQIGNYPPTFQDVSTVFEGAVTPGAESMSMATQPGQSETVRFTASEAGDFALVCILPGHATAGMWIRFRVSDNGSVGVQTAS